MSSRTLRSHARTPSQPQTSTDPTSRKRKSDSTDQNPKQPKAPKATARSTTTIIHRDHDETISTPNKPQSQGKRRTPTSKATAAASQAQMQTASEQSAGDPEPRASRTQISAEQAKSDPIVITETTGDLFKAPRGSILIHACNTQGTWGAGIALAFKGWYPNAYEVYKKHCTEYGESLLGGAFLIQPQGGSKPCAERADRHYIGCLFTSAEKGKGKGTPKQILGATRSAVEDLLVQVGERLKAGDRIAEVRMPKINSGLFGVRWEDTRAVLESFRVGESGVKEVKVVSRKQDG